MILGMVATEEKINGELVEKELSLKYVIYLFPVETREMVRDAFSVLQ